MDERDLLRMQRDIEDLIVRVRVIENVSSPYAQQLMIEFRDLQKKVAEYAEQGTPVSRRELLHVQDRLSEMRTELGRKADADDLHDIMEETRSNRTMVRSALIAAALSLGVALVLFLVERAVH
jgi:hypothetical protein